MAGREKFASRLGFILVSAGCAVGIGNVHMRNVRRCGIYRDVLGIFTHFRFADFGL